MECQFCHKQFSTIYVLKNHQKTTKMCIKIQEQQGVSVERKTYDCSFCHKQFTTSKNLGYHLEICKIKIVVENNRLLKSNNEFIQLGLDNKEEIRNLIEENRLLAERTKRLEEKYIPSISNNTNNTNSHNTINNHMTIFTSMTPERVTEVFNKHYTIETLMGGQKELANFVVDQFVAGKDKMLYLCVDRSRKKCMYTTDFETFHEDVNNDILLGQLTPAMDVIKDKVEWTEFEKKYNPQVDKIHESYDEILAVRKDGSMFRSQLCRRLPSSKEEKERMDQAHEKLDRLDLLRENETTLFTERKEELEQTYETSSIPTEPNTIVGIGLGRLDGMRLLFKNQGVYKIHKEMEPFIHDSIVAHDYEEYVKHGRYHGIQIWD